MKKLALALGTAGLVAMMVVAPNAHGQGGPPAFPTLPPVPGGPPGPPGSNPTATSTPLPTATPTATATTVPLTLSISLGHGTVKPGQSQSVTANTLPRAFISLTITFPNGKKDTVQGATGNAGKLRYSFTQPAGMTRGSNHKATVKATASALGQSKTATKKYTIG